MCDLHVGLGQKEKASGRRGDPFFKCSRRYQPAVGVVDLDRIQAGRVIREKFCAWQLVGIEVGLPGAIRKARCSAIKWSVRHASETGEPVVTLVSPIIVRPVIRVPDQADTLNVFYTVLYWD